MQKLYMPRQPKDGCDDSRCAYLTYVSEALMEPPEFADLDVQTLFDEGDRWVVVRYSVKAGFAVSVAYWHFYDSDGALTYTDEVWDGGSYDECGRLVGTTVVLVEDLSKGVPSYVYGCLYDADGHVCVTSVCPLGYDDVTGEADGTFYDPTSCGQAKLYGPMFPMDEEIVPGDDDEAAPDQW